MTTAADLLRRWLARVPEGARSLELLPLNGSPGSPIASWAADDARVEPEALRVAVLEAGQDHCDCEGEPMQLNATWVGKSAAKIGERRIRFTPDPAAAAAAASVPMGSDALVKELLATIRDQNKVLVNGMDTVVKASRAMLETMTDQIRILNERTTDARAHAAEVVDDSERELRTRALSVVIERAPELLDLVIHAGASRLMNGSGAAAAATDKTPPTQ